MTLGDVAAGVLIMNKQYGDINTARDQVMHIFKVEFPYWSFRDWNAEISDSCAKNMLKIYQNTSLPVKQLIIELPSLIDTCNRLPIHR